VAAAERVFAWLDAPPAPISSLAQPAAAVANAMQVRFSNVSYRYPDAAHDALSNIDLELQPGTLTALVGPSGAGKSTLVDLLLRFAESSVGAIHADGERIASFDPVLWRRRLAFVPQRPRFFDGSVIDNLRTGRPEASLETVRDAARRAEVDAFVSRLPRGYETGLGEMAARASVGERQRLALARALLREAPLLVLDEPTSSLDPLTERAITRVLAEESRRRTVLVVAHRLHTVRAADQLIVLEGGRAAETGRHDDLMRRGGAYARLVSALPRDLPAPIGGLTPGYSELDEVVT
jgi:ATP-binding cassette subfamily C protein CydD